MGLFSPREFFAGKLDEDASAERFQQRFALRAHDYVKGRTDQLHVVFDMMQRYFSLVFTMGDTREHGPLVYVPPPEGGPRGAVRPLR